MIECFIRIVAVMINVFRLSPERKLVYAPLANEEHQSFYAHVTLTEQKTGKTKLIALNKQVIGALSQCYLHRKGEFIFANNRKEPQAISRVQAWRIIHAAVEAIGLMGKISCHSLRKTFGYHAWTSGEVSPVVIMDIYNHSNYETTRRYLGVAQDDLDAAYLKLELIS